MPGSRRGARPRTLIVDGRVRVNGSVARLGESADPDHDRIEVDGRPLAAAAPAIHLAIHKPRGFLSSARDERGRRSIVGLVEAGGARLWPAGRLDVESEGLMLLTNDGEWANSVLHPAVRDRARVRRIGGAVALTRPRCASFAMASCSRMARLGCWPCVRRRRRPRSRARGPRTGTWLRVRIGEGRKREVRRLFDAVDVDVERLVRTRIGSITLAGLREGEWRHLRRAEVVGLAGGSRR